MIHAADQVSAGPCSATATACPNRSPPPPPNTSTGLTKPSTFLRGLRGAHAYRALVGEERPRGERGSGHVTGRHVSSSLAAGSRTSCGSMAWHSRRPHSAMLCHAMPCDAMLRYAMRWPAGPCPGSPSARPPTRTILPPPRCLPPRPPPRESSRARRTQTGSAPDMAPRGGGRQQAANAMVRDGGSPACPLGQASSWSQHRTRRSTCASSAAAAPARAHERYMGKPRCVAPGSIA